MGRAQQKRPCVETPNENEEAEKTTLEMHKKEDGTKRVTRTSSRKTLAEVNTNQPPLTAAEPQPALEKRPARGGRRKKVVEDPVTVPTKRTTRAASRKAAAAAVKVVVLESDEEVAGSTESEAVPMEEVCGLTLIQLCTSMQCIALLYLQLKVLCNVVCLNSVGCFSCM